MVITILMLTVSLPAKADYLEDYLQFGPSVVNTALRFTSLSSPYSRQERLCFQVTSWALTLGITEAGKRIVHRERPDHSDNRSFPSGHTARAFMGAEQVRINYGLWWGMGCYAMATTVGVLRVVHDRHYTTDVIAGAVIGVGSVQLARLLLPWEKKVLGIKNDVAVAVTPFGAALAITF